MVEVDLRPCLFVRPAAVLWCAIYPLLLEQSSKRSVVLVPESTGVASYLRAVELFDVLRAGNVEVDDRGVRADKPSKIIPPPTHFATESEAEELANTAHEGLSAAGLGASNLYPVISEIFAELANNAVQHSESPVGAYGFIQFFKFEEGERFVCGVADGGIGIRASLERNPKLREKTRYDWAAIDLAIRERVSGTGDKTRGIGLYGVSEDMRVPGRSLIIQSGIGSLLLSEDVQSEARRTALFPGTLTYASLPT
ncbi:MAG: hypothetical protein ACYDCC_08985 [Actinomycetota bacterium]